MANGSLKWFPPNRPATTFPEFHNLKGIPQEKSYLFVCQWLNLEPPYSGIKEMVNFHQIEGLDAKIRSKFLE